MSDELTADLFAVPRPVIAIVGRPNVGKSTVFNRILGNKTAIVDDVPGVTRDRNYADGAYRGRAFRLVDTGGLDPDAHDPMLTLVRQQSQIAIAEANAIIFVMDGRAGLTPADQEIAGLLRRTTKPVFIAVNKIDTPKSESLTADFYRLGFERLYPVSAEHGIGIDDLLDDLYPLLPDTLEEAGTLPPRIAVVGRPNVGKSTLINTLLGQDRVVVSAVPGTTRDAIDTAVIRDGRRYVFTDTAGIRRRGRVDEGIEVFSVSRALAAMGRSDVAVLVVDGAEGITEQDTKIAGLILKQGRACVLFINKWDLKTGAPDARKRFEADLARRFRFLSWATPVFGSALKPEAPSLLLPAVDRAMTAFSQRVSTGALNKFVQKLVMEHPVPAGKGKPAKASKSIFMTQVASKPPTFALFVGRPENVTKAYLRLLENRIREQFGFFGTPMRMLVREK
ncbi:MAG TPA: ribosome biogenesis GTPase Der [Nitrospirales bacterium]|nr:ribosome biogenesis GTPase Der [Nitrospirales bacterium]